MIHKSDYTFIMSEKLPIGRASNYIIKKSVLEKGTLMRTYSPAGAFYLDRTDSSMPVVKLMKGNQVIMSDTPMEQMGLRVPVGLAHGKVLVIGLGIGIFPTLLREYNKRVENVLIIETSRHVVKLVYPHIRNSKTTIQICDGWGFLTACIDKFDFIFIDVWPAITTTIREIDKWTKLAEPCLTEGGEVRCWLQELYDRIKGKLPEEHAQRIGVPVTGPPCLICGKTFRYDYAGLCMDCADDMEVSEVYAKTQKQ